ncbi:MAG: DNA polymerase IV [Candidatus Shapirobacteria bacterium]
MFIDLNSCFASIEQQANPLLRGRPIAVAAYDSPRGCILAPSVEAKKLGIKVGMRVADGQLICPGLLVLTPDPHKYRAVHRQLRAILGQYTTQFVAKSVDEFVLNLEGFPAFRRGLFTVGQEIKSRIRSEIGDWLTVSIGLAPNRFLAKTASNLKKPDGLEEINISNFKQIYARLSLTDLTGIDKNLAARLNLVGIHTVLDFFGSSLSRLKSAFRSVCGYYWYLRLRGWEIDDVEFGRKSFGHMYSLPRPLVTKAELSPILAKLVEKTCYRLRQKGYHTRGLHLAVLYRDHSFWHQGMATQATLFSSADIYKLALRILSRSPYLKPVANLSVSCFNLVKSQSVQFDLFDTVAPKLRLTQALDNINTIYGNFVITPAVMLGTGDQVLDRIGFGNI